MIGVADLLIRVKTDTKDAISGIGALYVGLTGLAVGAGAASVEFVKMGMDAQHQFAIIQGFTGASKSQMVQYTKGLEDMATELGFTMAEGAKGLYYVISAGFRGADALAVFKVAAEGAKASGASLKDVSNGLTSAMNAYGAKASEAAKYSDIMATAVTYGKQTFADFADNIGKAVLMAATAHVPFEQVAAAESALTEKGLPAANAMTYLRYMFSKLVVDIPGLQKEVLKLGGHFDATKYASLDLAQKLMYLQNQTGISEGAFIKLTGGARGSQAALGLIGDKGVAFEKILGQMSKSAGLTANAFKIHDHTMTGGFEDIQAAISVAAYEVVHFANSFFQPPFVDVTDAIKAITNKFISLEPAMKRNLLALEDIGSSLKPVLGLFVDLGTWIFTNKAAFLTFSGLLTTIAGTFAIFKTVNAVRALWSFEAEMVTATLKTLGFIGAQAAAAASTDVVQASLWGEATAATAADVATAPLVLPLWAIVAAVAAVVAGITALVYWINNSKQGMALWHAVVKNAGDDFSQFGSVMSQVGIVLQKVGGWIKTQFVAAVAFVTPTFQQASQELLKFATNIGNILGPAIRTFQRDLPTSINTFQKVWTIAWAAISFVVGNTWERVRVVTETAWGIIKGLVMIYWSLIQGGITIGLDLLSMKWSKAWGDMKGMLSGVWAGIAQIVGSAMSGIVTTMIDDVASVATLFARIPGPVGDMARKVLKEMDALRSNTTATQTTITSASHATQTQVATTTATMSNQVVTAMGTMHRRVSTETLGMSTDTIVAVKTMHTQSVKHSQDMGATIQTTLKNAWDAVRNGVGDAFNKIGTSIHNQLSQWGQDIGNFFSGIGTAIHNKVTDVQTALGKWWTSVEKAWTSGIDNLGKDWTNFWAPTGQFFNTIGTAMHNLITTMGKNFSDLGTSSHKAWDQFMASPLAHQIGDTFNKFGTNIHNKLSEWGKNIGDAFSAFGTTIHDKLSAIGSAIGTWFSDRGTDIHNKLSDWGTTIGKAFDAFGTAIHTKLITIETTIGSWFSARGTDIHNQLSQWGTTIGKAFDAFGTSIHNKLVAIQTTIGKWFSDRGTDIHTQLSQWGVTIGNAFSNFGSTIHTKLDQIRNTIGKWFSDRGTDIHNQLSQWGTTIGNAFSNFGKSVHDKLDQIKASIGDFLGKAGKAWGDGWNKVNAELGGALNTMWKGIQGFVGNVFGALGNFLNGKNGLIPSAKTWGSSMLSGFTSGISGMWNSFLGTIHKFIGDGNSKANDGSLVGYVKGLLGIRSPSSVFASMGVQMFEGLVNGFSGHNLAGNIGGFISHSLGGIGNVIKNMVSKNMIDLSQIPIKGWNFLKSLGGSLMNDLQNLLGMGGGAAGSGSMAHPNIGGNVVQWLLQAIADTGVPQSWLTGLEIIAQHESGGNPNAVNRWDSNWLAGHPSMGLMQMIMSTFMANALPGMAQIFNPIDNAAAAIRYIERRYGNINNVPGVHAVEMGRPYVGYALGGWINEPIYGVGKSGTRYQFGEKGPEFVSPAGKHTTDGKTYHFENHFYGSNLTAQDVIREQAWQMMIHGS